jgi:hypothetical protein
MAGTPKDSARGPCVLRHLLRTAAHTSGGGRIGSGSAAGALQASIARGLPLWPAGDGSCAIFTPGCTKYPRHRWFFSPSETPRPPAGCSVSRETERRRPVQGRSANQTPRRRRAALPQLRVGLHAVLLVLRCGMIASRAGGGMRFAPLGPWRRRMPLVGQSHPVIRRAVQSNVTGVRPRRCVPFRAWSRIDPAFAVSRETDRSTTQPGGEVRCRFRHDCSGATRVWPCARIAAARLRRRKNIPSAIRGSDSEPLPPASASPKIERPGNHQVGRSSRGQVHRGAAPHPARYVRPIPPNPICSARPTIGPGPRCRRQRP